MNRWALLPLACLATTSVSMVLVWAWQRRSKNAGIVDLLWTASLGGCAVVYGVGAEGWAPRRALVATLAALWSARLTLHLAKRIFSEREDGRYATMRADWGERFDSRMFWFFQAQALLAVLLSLAFLVPCVADSAGWRAWDGLGLALWLISVGGESLADRQLRSFRADPANRGKTCRAGLWAYSRHPNYFFEWLHWLVYPVIAIGLPWGWAVWLAPALMLFLVLKVTGIPPTEAQSLRSRGDDYRAYQRSTNAFFPGPPKSDSVHILET